MKFYFNNLVVVTESDKLELKSVIDRLPDLVMKMVSMILQTSAQQFGFRARIFLVLTITHQSYICIRL